MNMQEFNTYFTGLSVIPRPSVMSKEELYASLSKEKWTQSAEKMYMLSLSTRERLPEELHNAMILWSFDLKSKPYVQMYLDWTKHCEEMEARRKRFERQCLMHDRMIVFTMIFTGSVLAVIIFSNLLNSLK